VPSPHCASEAAAAEVAAEQQQQQQQCPDGEAAAEGLQAAGGGAAPPPFGVPTGLVKKIMLVDDEVQRMSADAVRAIAKATELFVQQLAVRALQHAQAAKRKNFKAPDVAHLAGRDRCGEDKCRMLQRVFFEATW
jgi:histone H3/H4